MKRRSTILVIAMAVLMWSVAGPLRSTSLADPVTTPPVPRTALSIEDSGQPAGTLNIVQLAANVGERQLLTGWNLVSVPVVPSNSAVAQVLSSVAGHYDLVTNYDAYNGVWRSYNPSVPGAATLSELNERTAFWIHVTQADTLAVSGTMPGSTDQQLYAGWNLVAYPAMESREVGRALESIAGYYTLVYGYEEGSANPWQRYSSATPSWAISLTHLEPGHGYWVYATQNCTLSVASGMERFGVAANGAITECDYPELGVGWYHNWGISNSAPAGLAFFAIAGASGNTAAQQSAAIESNLANHPERYPDGMVWLIGNEVGWDFKFSPTEYAQFYHDWYTYLKGLNSTFEVGTGAIMPLVALYWGEGGRLNGIEWFTEVRGQYQTLYGGEMPVDWYNMHVYLENDYYGTIEQFRQAIANQWNGRAKPVVITEIGSLQLGNEARIPTFMTEIFDYLNSATSQQYGCTTDGNRLVQRWAWFALTGWSPDKGSHRWDFTALFDYDTKAMLTMGETYASYTATHSD